jgi:septal ring factor EnvC (AmiA/AmiB activator)
MDIEIPDNEDAACDLDVLMSNLASRGEYVNAGVVSGAARRLRADAEEIARLESQLAASEAALASRQDAYDRLEVAIDESERKRERLGNSLAASEDAMAELQTEKCVLETQLEEERAARAEAERLAVWAVRNARVEMNPFDGCPYTEWPEQTWRDGDSDAGILAALRQAEETTR